MLMSEYIKKDNLKKLREHLEKDNIYLVSSYSCKFKNDDFAIEKNYRFNEDCGIELGIITNGVTIITDDYYEIPTSKPWCLLYFDDCGLRKMESLSDQGLKNLLNMFKEDKNEIKS